MIVIDSIQIPSQDSQDGEAGGPAGWWRRPRYCAPCHCVQERAHCHLHQTKPGGDAVRGTVKHDIGLLLPLPQQGPPCTRLGPGQVGRGSALLLARAVRASEDPPTARSPLSLCQPRRGRRGGGAPLLPAPFSLHGPIDFPLGKLTAL